jgi:hypothetical protein
MRNGPSTSMMSSGPPSRVETVWVNWEWMTARRHSTFNKIKATCDELGMIEMMSFKYHWNKEIICQFYATLYFDADE